MYTNIPQDPNILLSFVNTRLRDNYSSLALLCDDLDIDETELKARLATIGYTYEPQLNKFV